MIKTQQPHTTFKDFQMLARLGEGSYSSVYKVKRLSDNQIYAFKRVKMDQLNDKEKENALNEVRILASISDPFIIGYKEAFFDENSNSLCIVMEYADSGDLQKMIKTSVDSGKYIPEHQIWQCLLHIAKGLKTLHEMHILHRDLKCANVFVSTENVFKLGDLNVSKVAQKGLVYTQTGTPYYASPEVWRDEAYDMKSDIWSLGCVLYEMAALKPPFRANDMQGLFKKVQKGFFERIPRVYSDDLQNIICEFLKVQPSLRPTSQQILNNPVLQNYVKDNDLEMLRDNSKAKLLGTIEVPKNLKFLRERLPRPNYDKSKLNSSFEKEKETKRVVVMRGESAGSRRTEKNKYTSKESIFEEEIKKLNMKKAEEIKEKKPQTPKIDEKEVQRPSSRNSENLINNADKKPGSRPPSRNKDLIGEKKSSALNSPLPDIHMKKNNSRVVGKSSIDELKPLLSPKQGHIEALQQRNDPIKNVKSPSGVRSPINLNVLEKQKKNLANIPIIRPNSGVRRPYSHVAKRNEESVKEEKVKPQIRVNSRPSTRNMVKNIRPLSGMERERPPINDALLYMNKEMITKKKNVISVGHLHSNKPNENYGDALDLLKMEIQQKQKKPIVSPEIPVVIRNKATKVAPRVYSGNQRPEILRKNSQNVEDEYNNINVFKNKLNLQEKPITAPNVARPRYKIVTKDQKKAENPNSSRAAVGQQILNNNYKIYLKEQNNLY